MLVIVLHECRRLEGTEEAPMLLGDPWLGGFSFWAIKLDLFVPKVQSPLRTSANQRSGLLLQPNQVGNNQILQFIFLWGSLHLFVALKVDWMEIWSTGTTFWSLFVGYAMKASYFTVENQSLRRSSQCSIAIVWLRVNSYAKLRKSRTALSSENFYKNTRSLLLSLCSFCCWVPFKEQVQRQNSVYTFYVLICFTSQDTIKDACYNKYLWAMSANSSTMVFVQQTN